MEVAPTVPVANVVALFDHLHDALEAFLALAFSFAFLPGPLREVFLLLQIAVAVFLFLPVWLGHRFVRRLLIEAGFVNG
jgi:hypothetical protein